MQPHPERAEQQPGHHADHSGALVEHIEQIPGQVQRIGQEEPSHAGEKEHECRRPGQHTQPAPRLRLARREPLKNIERKTVLRDGLDWVELMPNSTRQAITELLAVFPQHHQVGRRLRILHQRLDDPAAFRSWHRDLEHQWQSLIDKAPTCP